MPPDSMLCFHSARTAGPTRLILCAIFNIECTIFHCAVILLPTFFQCLNLHTNVESKNWAFAERKHCMKKKNRLDWLHAAHGWVISLLTCCSLCEPQIWVSCLFCFSCQFSMSHRSEVFSLSEKMTESVREWALAVSVFQSKPCCRNSCVTEAFFLLQVLQKTSTELPPHCTL